MDAGAPLLEASALTQAFRVPARLPFAKPHVVHAVSEVSFALAPGECLGLVGETGCGKSTLARTIMQAPPPASGDVLFRGQSLVTADRDTRRSLRGDAGPASTCRSRHSFSTCSSGSAAISAWPISSSRTISAWSAISAIESR
jgi:energy-coupling factor transporter ATP-binding protein EcfA2